MTEVRIDPGRIRHVSRLMADQGDELALLSVTLGHQQAPIMLSADVELARAGTMARITEALNAIDRLAAELRDDATEVTALVQQAQWADSTGADRWPVPLEVPGPASGAVGPRASQGNRPFELPGPADGRWLLGQGLNLVGTRASVAGFVARATVGRTVGPQRWNQAVQGGTMAATRQLIGTAAAGGDLWRLATDPREFAVRLLITGDHHKPATGDYGGTYTTRTVEPFPGASGHDPVERGREVVMRQLAETGRESQINNDEFQVVDHGDNRYTVILPGVTDLTTPGLGLNPHTRTVRDLDVNSIGSSFSTSIEENRYAMMVDSGLMRLGVPRGAELFIVGHSYGSDTALDLAADPRFNGGHYRVTHAVAAAYHSEPQLASVQPQTEVLVLRNEHDLAVIAESVTDHLTFDQADRFDHDAVVREFSGGWSAAGHHQDHYVDYVAATDDPAVEAFFASIDAAGYGGRGDGVSIDVSVPGPRSGPPEPPLAQLLRTGTVLLPGPATRTPDRLLSALSSVVGLRGRLP